MIEKKQMSAKVFTDTNILIYLFDKSEKKKDIAKKVLNNIPIISVQICNELSNILLKKFMFDEKDVKLIINRIVESSSFYQIDQYTVSKALDIREKYKFSYYDSLVIASAINSKSKILYSEDMQHKQNIETLTILNPFKEFLCV
ncbi:MAG: PIN domain-containing protein [Campylobacterales bacterium]